MTDAPPLLPGRPTPITSTERLRRIARAQALMRAQGIAALLIEPGASTISFTGVDRFRSERLTAAILPAQAEVALITPSPVRQTLGISADVRVWQEDEDLLVLVAAILKDRRAAAGPIAIEETVRDFAVDGLKRALPSAPLASGATVRGSGYTNRRRRSR